MCYESVEWCRVSGDERSARLRPLDASQSASGADRHWGVSRFGFRSAAATARTQRGNDHVHFVSRRRADADAQDADIAADYIKSHRR